MRALTTILFATATLLGGATATATAADGAELRATAQQMAELEGSYGLPDGHRARIFMLDNRLYLDLGRRYQAYKELELAGPGQWVTRDRTLALQFKPGQAADQIVLNIRGDMPADLAPIRLAARDQRGRGGID